MTFYERAIVVFLTSLCWAGLSLDAQPAQLDFRQYNTDDGLPSSETYTIVQDRAGYLWIGTDNGVARFDGYEFEVFDTDDGLEDMVVFGIVEDHKDRIWISTYSGKIYFFENGRFHPFEHNHVLETIKRTKLLGVLIDVTPDEELIMSFKDAGFLRVTSQGDTEWLSGAEVRSLTIYESLDSGVLTSAPRPHGFFHQMAGTFGDSLVVGLMNEEAIRDFTRVNYADINSTRIYFAAVYKTAEGRESVLSNTYNVVILDEEGNVKYNFPTPYSHYNYFLPGQEAKTYWGFFERGGGLQGYDFRGNARQPEVSQQLFGRSLTSGLFDRSGGFWVTTLDAGLFYCPYPQQRIYLKEDDDQNSKAISIELVGAGEFYAGYEDGSLFYYQRNTPSLRSVQEVELIAPERLFDMYYDSLSSKMLTPYYSFTHPITGKEKLSSATVVRHTDTSGVYFMVKYFNKPAAENTRILYSCNISNVGVYDLEKGIIFNRSTSPGSLAGNAHVFGVHPDGRMLVGTLLGILVLREDGSLEPDNLGIPELSNRVVFIQDLGNQDLLIGTRGDGVVYVGPDTTFVVREADGLASNMIRDIHLSRKGTAWISTLNGLSRFNLLKGGREYNLRTFRMEHGLPSNEVYQADTYEDEVWLATSAGVVRFEEPPPATVSPRPIIRSVVLNGTKLPDTTVYAFPPLVEDVSISFGTINYVLADQVPYRYRLNDFSPWQYSRERTVNFPRLGAGDYQFEVQSRNQDGVWSESTIREISVAKPWYATVWAILGGVALVAAALSSYFLLRERRRRREQDLLFQITQLEHAALHAQMNPHFVFNALNSIQNFVLENDAKQAATYLSRFARVIRQTLRSSVDGQHHLGEELMMLETYLGLEKLRFKNGFSFSLKVDPELPKEEIVLPPLLIQPFIENAIIHGLKDRKRGGEISVRFTGTSAQLMVVVEDNGKGYKSGDAEKSNSLGMDITRRRLAMMNEGKDGVSGMEIVPITLSSGEVRGTRVTLYIRPLTSTAPASAPTKT